MKRSQPRVTWKSGIRCRAGIFQLSLLIFILQVSSFRPLLAAPSWWYSRNVIETNSVVADYAPVVLGQLKWMATNACDELEAGLPGGAGTDVWSIVTNFSALSNNWLTVNVGQLKAVAEPFYARLNVVQYYTNGYRPWTSMTNDDRDFAIANIGQMKNVFDFDVSIDGDSDSLFDWWEVRYFGSVTNQTGAQDFDTDDLNNSNEYWHSTCPTNPNTDGDEASDGVEVEAGSDPLNSNSFPVSISGTITYTSSQTGLIWVVAVTSSASWATNHSFAFASPGAYSISNVPNLTTYWVKAWRDMNGNKVADTNSEAWGEYTGNSISLTTNVAGIDIVMDRGDSDGDGLADWVETGTGIYVSPTNTGTDPNLADTDSDGISDGAEVAARTNPNNADTNKPTVNITFPVNNDRWVALP